MNPMPRQSGRTLPVVARSHTGPPLLEIVRLSYAAPGTGKSMSTSTTPPSPVQCLDVARHGATALVLVKGLGNMHLAPTLQSFVEKGIGQGCVRIALDLEQCAGMDSTFMGTIVGLSVTLRERDGWLCVMNVGADNERLLRMLGVWEFITVVRQPFPDPSPLVRLHPTTDTSARLVQIKEAHKRLVEIDERNRARFGTFIEAVDRQVEQAADADDADGDIEEIPSDYAELPPAASQIIALPYDFPNIPPPPSTPTPPRK